MPKRGPLRRVASVIVLLFVLLHAYFAWHPKQPGDFSRVYNEQAAYIEFAGEIAPLALTQGRRGFTLRILLSEFFKFNPVALTCLLLPLAYLEYRLRLIDLRNWIEIFTTLYFHGSKYKRVSSFAV